MPLCGREKMRPDPCELGRIGEDAACAFLEEDAFEIIERNWRVAAGEIDVIARRGGVTVFVEVKSRTSAAFGEPEESVTPAKARRIRGLAREYLAGHPACGDVRFDVVALMLDSAGGVREIRHIPDAF
jgi:putative endonuclease